MTTATAMRLRGYAGPSDVPEIVRIFNAASEADRVDEVWAEEGLTAWLSHASDQFDPARDILIGEIDDDRVVAVGRVEWADNRDGTTRDYRIFGVVDPALRGQGYGTELLAALEDLSRANAATHSHERESVLMSFAAVGRPPDTFLRANGYVPVRWFIDMVRPNLDDIVEPPLPEGIELRPVTPDEHETIWRANREAFRDHWGGSDESLEQLQRILEDPDTDTSLWLTAWDGDEVAGGVWNEIRSAENEALGIRRGWLNSVYTRRPWRKRGLASALIGRSLTLLKERGMTSAILGVDAANPTGANALYESAGFEVHDTFLALRKPMDGPPT